MDSSSLTRDHESRTYEGCFIVLAALYIAGPPILAAMWAFYEHDVWLLCGIAVSYIASFLVTWSAKPFALFFCLCIGAWLRFGFSIHQHITFFFFCAVWGTFLYSMADDAQRRSRRSDL